jgi:site-specific DNA recombinase
MSMPALRVAFYARVSSEQQTEQGTITSQVAALEARIGGDGFHLEPDHRFIDEGYSGASLVRPALECLRDTVATGAVDRVYVHSPDRLARRYAYQVLIIDEFQRLGVEIVFLNRAIGLSPEDDLLLQVQGMVAEYERAKILERSRRGKRHAAHDGRVSVLSGAPYGYHYIGKHEGGGVARYAIDETEASVVRLMFQWIGRERLSIGEVCRRLRQQDCVTRSGKPAWDRATVWGILKNPAYIGTAAFGKTRIGPMRERLRPIRGGVEQPRWPYSAYAVPEAEWLKVPVPALIDSDLFAAVQEQLAENRQRNRQNRRGQRYLLQGLLVCRRCGYAYYGKAISPRAAKGKRRDYAYYRCCGSDAHRFGGQRLCANPQLRTDRADAVVWQEVQRLLQDPGMIAAEYERRLHQAQHPDAERPDLVTAEAQIAKLRRGIARLIDGYAEGLIEKAEFEQRITGLRQRITQWEQQAAALRDQAALRRTLSLIIGRLEDFAKQIQERMTAPEWSLQRDLIRLLVKRVEVDHDEINVVFRVAPPPGSRPPGSEGGRILQDCWRGGQPDAGQPLHESFPEALATKRSERRLSSPGRLLRRRLRHPQPRLRGRGPGVDPAGDGQDRAGAQRGKDLDPECTAGTLRLSWLLVRLTSRSEGRPLVSGCEPVEEECATA